MKSLLLAIDIGTSGAKLLLLDASTGKTDSVTVSYPTSSPMPGYAEQNPDSWWQAVQSGIPALLASAGRSADEIAAIGIDSVSWTPVLLNKAGKVLSSAPLWYDTRSGKECEKLSEYAEKAFLVSGNPMQPYYLLPKIKWFAANRPEVLAETAHILSGNGFIGYRLTGTMTQDECQGYGWCFFDMAKGEYDATFAEELGFDLSLLPDICKCTDIIGTVTPEAARACGLVSGIPVVAGGLDAACGAVGAGVYEPGAIHEQSGSAGGMSICTDTCPSSRGLILSRHVVPGYWLLQGGTVGGGNLVRWLLEQLANGEDAKQLRNRLTDEAARIPAGSDGLLFLPYMAGERSPIWNPDAKGVFFGLDYSKTPAHMMRAVLEGAAFSLRHNMEAAGNPAGTLLAVGGASRNPLWMQIKADITGHPICAVNSPDATAIGCAMVAGVGAGILKGFDEVKRYAASEAPYWPDSSCAAQYESSYEKYLLLYDRLKDLMN